MKTLGAFSGYSSSDIPACKVFYKETLGIELEEQMGGLRFTINGQKVFIYPKPDHQPAVFTVLNFVVENIDATIDELVAKGVSFERYEGLPAQQDDRGVLRGKDAGMGPNIAWFKDPSGNILALTEE
jgi:predicted enzyme related to lactoylglutathione lyase